MAPDVIFLDEAIANLDAMEAELARFATAADPEGVHAVFRHAHSIKGGAAAFGLTAVTELMHLVESVLDRSRSSGVLPDDAVADLLHEAVHAARQMLVDDDPSQSPSAQDLATRLRQQALEPDTHRGGRLRRIAIRSVETDVVSAAVINLFTEISGLGELLTVERGVDGEQVFVVRCAARDHELLDLLAMHVERDCVRIAAPTAASTAKSAPAGPVSASETGGASLRVDAIALRRLVQLARSLTHMPVPAPLPRDQAHTSQWLQTTEALCQGLDDLCHAPASSLFSRIPALLRRLSTQLDKQFVLSVTGGDTRLDRAVLQQLADPLMHLVRNACDHGIEVAPQRVAAGKPTEGHIDLSAWREPGRVRVSVRDDGAGLSRDKVLQAARLRAIAVPDEPDDEAVWQLVFAPGLSTAAAVSEVSGRGVGMDAVRRKVVAIGGDVSITSSFGKGVCVTLSIPDGDASLPDASG